MVLADVQCWENCAIFEFEFESAQLERCWTGGMFERPCSDADSDAHAVGFSVANGVNVGEHELFTLKEIAMSSKLLTPATDGQEKAVGKRAEGLQSSWVDTWPCSTSNGGRLASNGVEWHMRALTRKAPLVSQPSRIRAQV